MTDQSDAGSAGIFSRRTNRTQEGPTSGSPEGGRGGKKRAERHSAEGQKEWYGQNLDDDPGRAM
eukprot:882977-Prorocentrum_minimum.AAC.1